MKKSIAPASPTAEQQFTALISKLNPETQKLVIAVRKAMQKRFPSANELAYDYSRNFVMSWSPNETGADAVVAIAVDEKEFRFVFAQGVHLPDPKKVLLGNAGQIRYIPVKSIKDIQTPEVEALLTAAENKLRIPLAKTGRGALIIKSSKKPAKPAARKTAAKKAVKKSAVKKIAKPAAKKSRKAGA